MKSKTPNWNAQTYWPDRALLILGFSVRQCGRLNNLEMWCSNVIGNVRRKVIILMEKQIFVTGVIYLKYG